MPPQPKKKKPTDQPEDNDEGGDDGGDEEAPLTKADVAKMINASVTGLLNRKLGPAIESAVGAAVKKLAPTAPEEPDEDEPDEDAEDADEPPAAKAAKKPAKGARPDPQVAKLTKQLGEVNRKLAEEAERRQKEETARKNALIDSELTRALTELGVDKNRLRGALMVHRATASVLDEENEAPRVVFRVKRDGYEDELAPGEALKEWAGTDEGKSYLAPTGSPGGSGARPPRPAGPKGKAAPGSPEAKAERVAGAKKDLLGAVSSLVAGGSIAIE